MDAGENSRDAATDFAEFSQDITQGIEERDLLLLLAVVPIVLTAVFLSPKSTQQSFMLDFQHPQVITLLTYAFVHRDFTHYATNLGAYLTLAALIYPLCIVAREKALFRYTWFTFVLFVPVIIALLELASPIAPDTAAGFSGVVAAFLGFLPVSLTLYLRNRISTQIQVAHAVVLYLIAAAMIAYTYTGRSSVTLGTVAATIAVTAFYTYQTGVEGFTASFAALAVMHGYLQLVMAAVFFFLAAPILLFPATITLETGVVDIFAHYLGLTLGFFLPLLYLTYRDTDISQLIPDSAKP